MKKGPFENSSLRGGHWFSFPFSVVETEALSQHSHTIGNIDFSVGILMAFTKVIHRSKSTIPHLVAPDSLWEMVPEIASEIEVSEEMRFLVSIKKWYFLVSSENRLVNIYGILMNERASRKLARQADAKQANVFTGAEHNKKCVKFMWIFTMW